MLRLKKYWTFDDVLLKPKFSILDSRSDANISTEICGVSFDVPIISANMETCTEWQMAQVMYESGACGVIHRFMPVDRQINQIKRLHDLGVKKFGASLGVNEDSKEAIKRIFDSGVLPSFFVIDVAHAHAAKVVRMIEYYLSTYKHPLMVGNIATEEAAIFFSEYPIQAVKVGIGPGSMCTTRLVTGCGIPQLSSINEVYDVLRNTDIKIIADGGIRTSGDIVKAIAAGADAVMIGSLLAGTSEAPGPFITVKGLRHKVYRGMASKDAQVARPDKHMAYEEVVPEGEGKLEPIKGSARHIINQLAGGIKSGISYCGVADLAGLRENAEFVLVSGSCVTENGTRA